MKKESPDVVRVMLRLSKEYPRDLGILMPLVLNLLTLKPGQAFFMTVDEPHAYLRGDILEVEYVQHDTTQLLCIWCRAHPFSRKYRMALWIFRVDLYERLLSATRMRDIIGHTKS